tara:strand:+ start:396 stop:956 length:561 start_codon:yes stop_codon:yes gene_type:complete
MKKHQLHQSKLISDNYAYFVTNSIIAHNSLLEKYNIENSTWEHYKYNFFSLTSSNLLFFELYKELRTVIKNFIKDDRPLWFQSWINFHPNNTVERELPFHSHKYPYHGYISIDPQNTTTIFKNGLKIKNQPGQIYIGPGRNWGDNSEYDHKVEIDEKYTLPRITIGFDVNDEINKHHHELSFIPLI